ncbi:unnamed protein product [Toxocara canis]|uniref:Carboxypeptidase regulatory-like domain-containing protein n=1 Tax=Toxocara canis TaxID=6265 RepID=A0A183UUD0_TOXCA|nr:unnamed protein product [Toxocara canis]
MRALWFAIIACVVSVWAYSPLRKQPPAQVDIYEEGKRKADGNLIQKVNFVVIGSAIDNESNSTPLPQEEKRTH